MKVFVWRALLSKAVMKEPTRERRVLLEVKVAMRDGSWLLLPRDCGF